MRGFYRLLLTWVLALLSGSLLTVLGGLAQYSDPNGAQYGNQNGAQYGNQNGGQYSPQSPIQNGASSSSGAQEPRMNLEQARSYWLSLVNRDRAAHGVGPVQLDPIANKAAQWHSDAMAKDLFNSHWHPDGMKPQQRYTQSGGMDYDAENSHGSAPQAVLKSTVAAEQTFTAAEIEAEEQCYFDEKPPHDGHRLNILEKQRTHVGIGITLLSLDSEGGGSHFRQLTSSQEFINRYGGYVVSANELKPNVPFQFGGVVWPPFNVYEISVMRENFQEPISMDVLSLQTTGPFHGSYSGPKEKVVTVFPLSYGQKPNAHLQVSGTKFLYELVPERGWKPGLYYVLLWVRDGNNNSVPASMRVLPLTKL
jgi:hypothetical protein